MKYQRNYYGVKVILFISFWCIGLTLSAQGKNDFLVSGTVVDTITKQPIEYVSLALYGINSSKPINGTITNNKGEFTIQGLPAGKYILKASFVGYKNKVKPIEISNTGSYHFDPIELNSSTVNLQEVQITGRQSEKQINIEKTKINVSQNISAGSGNITEVIKSISSISIDANNNIFLRGNGNILILIDGKPTTVSSLNSIPASNVENIEVITNPDAKYDAEGTGGIINVVMKKQNVSGTNGIVTINYGIENRFNGGIGLGFKKYKWDINFNYNIRYEKQTIHSNLNRQLYFEPLKIDQIIKSTQITPTQIAEISIAYKPNKKNWLATSAKIILPELTNKQNIFNTQYYDTLPAKTFNRRNDIQFLRKTVEASLSYRKIFEERKNELSFDATYSHTKGNRPADYYVNNEFIQKADGGGAPSNISLQVDYLKQIFNTGKIESGLKGFSRWNTFYYHFYDYNTISGQWVYNTLFSNSLEHKEYIYSGYLMYSDSLLEKIFFKAGARIDYSTSDLIQNTTNENIYNEYTYPFPFLLLKYTLNPSQNLALSVTRRVTRPTYPQLNPYISMIDQLTYESGNKYLKPEVIDKIEINHSWTKEKFDLKSNLYFSTTKDYITQTTALSDSNLLAISYANGNRLNKYGLEINGMIRFLKAFSVSPDFNVFYSTSSGTYNNIELISNALSWSGNIKTIFKAGMKTEFQMLFNYSSPTELPQFQLREIFFVDAGIKRYFLNNKLAASVTVSDIFNTRKWIIQSESQIYKLVNNSKNETRIFWFGLTYTFNSYKMTKPQTNGGAESDNGIIKIGQ
jgi:outer membrane receptor protein involved in Fe transport